MHSFWTKLRWVHILAAVALSFMLYALYFYLYISVFHQTLPKTLILRHKNEELTIRAQVLSREMDAYSEALASLEVRDEDIYRSIFGLNSIPSFVRDAGIQGDSHYEDLDFGDRKGIMRRLCRETDKVKKKAYVQSKSYDEIELMLYSADQLATSIPAICPIVPDRSKFHISSPFGYRVHPVLGHKRMHEGIDFSIKPGNPIYATGDGVVESVKIEKRGYGRQVVINHGFGYKTRYAHCKTILVVEGMRVKRGELIAETGNSGLTSGPHLHYEVIYKGRQVNPYHYFDLDMPLEQYKDMIKKVGDSSEKMYIHPSHRKQ